MLEDLSTYTEKLAALEKELADPAISKNVPRLRDAMRERSKLLALSEALDKYKKISKEIVLIQEMLADKSLADEELGKYARDELQSLQTNCQLLEKKIEDLLRPKNPMANKNAIVEIRAGTGGEEAAIFASDLYRMYLRYAERKKWTIEVLSVSNTQLGGFREIIFSLGGGAIYDTLQWESGVHRVQRVPETEASGRIHTSAVTVAVLPELEEMEIEIKEQDLRIDVMRSSGPGGQSVNTTDSAVRISHLPSGLVVHCQDEKSQHKNKDRAMRILRSRLYDMEQSKQQAERAAERKSMVGTGDRSERIRTYNFPQNRVTDHRIDLTLYKLHFVMDGDLDELLDGLKNYCQESNVRLADGHLIDGTSSEK